MKRILSLVLAMVMVLGSFGAVFAEDTTLAETAVETLMDLGVLTEGKLEQDLKRQDAIVLLSRLFGDEETAKDFPSEDLTFEDIADNFYNGYIAWAVAEELTEGKSETKFGFDDKLKTQELAMFLLRALGYGDVAYDEALTEAKELGLLVNVAEDAIVKRGDMALMTVNALGTPMKDSETTLAEQLELVMPEEEAPEELAVEEVVANNLKSFKVVFNQEVESASVVVKGKTGVEQKLSEDKMSLVGYYSGKLEQSESVEFTINAETEAGLEIEDLVITKVVNDTTIPAVLGAKALNAKQIEVQFSEPVVLSSDVYSLWNDIKIGENSMVASAKSVIFDNVVVFELSAALKEGSHDLEIAKVTDYANFVAPKATFSILVIEDKDAPVALEATVISKNVVEVTFNETLKGIGEYSVNGKDVTKDFVKGSNDTIVELTLADIDSLGIGAIIEVKVGYKGQTDIMGNDVKSWTYITTKTEDDSTLPTVVLTSVEELNKVTLTFSKSMLVEGKYTVLNKDGKVHKTGNIASTNFKDDTNNKIIVFKGSDLGLDEINPGDYSIKLTDMKDATIRTNPLAETTLEFKALDTRKPVALNRYLVTHGKDSDGTDNKNKDTVTIYFSEAMEVATIENLANYLLDEKPLHSMANTVSAKAAADGKSVVITYKEARDLTISNKFDVIGVKDAAGNAVLPEIAGNILLLSEDDIALTYSNSAEMVNANTIELTFNTPIASVHPSVLALYKTDDKGVITAVTGFSSAVAKVVKAEGLADVYVVSFTSPVKLSADASIYSLKVNAATAIKNIYGKTLSGFPADNILVAAEQITDSIAPTLTKVETGTNTNQIKFTFSEPIAVVTPSTFDALLMVKNADGQIVDVVSSTVYAGTNVWEIKFNTDLSGKTITVGFPTINGQIQDIVPSGHTANNLLPTEWFEVKVK